MLPDVDDNDLLLKTQIGLINLSALLWKLTDENFKLPRQAYKSDHCRKVRFKPSYTPDSYVFVDGLLLTTSTVKRLSFKGYSKLILKIHSPTVCWASYQKTVEILQESVETSVSIKYKTRVIQEGEDLVQPLKEIVKPGVPSPHPRTDYETTNRCCYMM